MNPSHAAALACCAALAGCVGVPVDELLASTEIVAELPLESGARVEAARFSAGRAGESQPGWGRFIVSPFATKSEYALVESGPGVVLEGRADGSASGFYRRIHIDPKRHPVMEWRWRVLQTPAGLDPRVNARDDSPARVIVAFHGDAARLDIGERFTLRLYKALTGEKMPYAIIMYSWASDAPVGTITPSIPTGKIQTIVVESGGGIGEWRELRRNVLEDYRLAFGEEPWDIVAVGVMTDASNTREKASAQFGDISFLPER
ncbi:MAG: DUF3047 domain-containing protein [Betaproteobacteria bacterium]|nr:MAG: DUF3047 domain-containing protein [Betaproteobacteria bacterium]